MSAKGITTANALIVIRSLGTLILIVKVADFIFAIDADILQQYHIAVLIRTVVQMAEYDMLIECQVIIDADNEKEAKDIAIKNIQNCLNPYYIEAYAEGQPVRQGTWEEERYDGLLQCYSATCSECGYESTDNYRISDSHKYCESCGTRMKEGGDTNC